MSYSAAKQKNLKMISVSKNATAVLYTALAVILARAVHASGGSDVGAAYLPMYAPVLLAGCTLGTRRGFAAGTAAPVLSFVFSSLFSGSAMPALEKLPYITAELIVFGSVGGLFAGKTAKNPLYAFPAVISAQAAGRLMYLLALTLSGLSAQEAFLAVLSGYAGLCIQVAAIPAWIVIFRFTVKHDRY